MRALVAVVLFAGCAGVGVGSPGAVQPSGARPGVMPLLSELPQDATRRDAVLDSAAQAAGPEQRSGLTSKEQTAETAAATAAAVIGGLLSKTKNVTLGGSMPIDETGGGTAAPHAPRAPGQSPGASHMPSAPNVTPFPSSDPADDAPPPPPPPPPVDDPASADLVPWIKVK